MIHVRPAHDLDAREMAAILNEVIEIGAGVCGGAFSGRAAGAIGGT